MNSGSVLTERATTYLASLQREEPMPTSAVERLIDAEGVAALPHWLSFHDQFAGYWEDLGSGDVAIWGLARLTEGIWCSPRSVGIYRTNGRVRGIACADVHPSHGYEMKPGGEVRTPHFSAASFAVRVERLAAWHAFSLGGAFKPDLACESFSPEELEAAVTSLSESLLPEASDEYARYYLSPSVIAFEAVANGVLAVFRRA